MRPSLGASYVALWVLSRSQVRRGQLCLGGALVRLFIELLPEVLMVKAQWPE